MQRVKLSLLENGDGFLVEALQKAHLAETDPRQWKFAVLCLVQTIELALKERLCREHTVLVYGNIDKPKNTVSLELAISRLQSICNISFSKKDCASIEAARKWRNQLVHFEWEYSPTEIKSVCARLLGFIQHFHRTILDRELHDLIDESTWAQAVQIMEFGEELYDRAQKRLKEESIPSEEIWQCEHCGWDAFVVYNHIDTCYLCGAVADVVECEVCKELVYLDDTEIQTDAWQETEYTVCKPCIENKIADAIAEDMYINQQIDLMRGK